VAKFESSVKMVEHPNDRSARDAQASVLLAAGDSRSTSSPGKLRRVGETLRTSTSF